MRKSFLALLASLSLIGCSTMHTVERVESASASSIQAGDHIIVTMIQGDTVAMTVRSAGNDTLRGIDDSGRLWEIPTRAIESVQLKQIEQEKRFSAGKTLGLSLIGVVALLVISAIALANALEDELDDFGD